MRELHFESEEFGDPNPENGLKSKIDDPRLLTMLYALARETDKPPKEILSESIFCSYMIDKLKDSLYCFRDDKLGDREIEVGQEQNLDEIFDEDRSVANFYFPMEYTFNPDFLTYLNFFSYRHELSLEEAALKFVETGLKIKFEQFFDFYKVRYFFRDADGEFYDPDFASENLPPETFIF